MMTNPVGGLLRATYHNTHYMLKYSDLINGDCWVMYDLIIKQQLNRIPKNFEEQVFRRMWKDIDTSPLAIQFIVGFMHHLVIELGDNEITDHDIKFIVGKTFGSYYVYTDERELLDSYALNNWGEAYTMADLVRACYQLKSEEEMTMVHMFIDECKESMEIYFRKFRGD